MSKREYIPVVSDVGTAVFPHLIEPDTKGQYADNRYKTGIRHGDAATEAFKKVLRDAAAKLLPDVSNPHLPIRTDKKDGSVSFTWKSKNKPVLWDAQRNKLPAGADIDIRGGSKIRLAGVITNYDKGISLWVDGVQVIELTERREPSFDAVEGGGFVYEAPSIVPESAPQGDAPAHKVSGDEFAL